MEWVKYRSQILLSLKKHVLRKDAHGSSSGSCRREFFQTTADRRSHVEYRLKWMSTKMSILNNQRTAPAFKTAAVKQIDPQVEMYIKRLKQLPPGLSVDADPKELREALANQEEDLVTPVQQKLLKRLLHKGKEPRPPVKKAPASKRIPAPVVKKTPAAAIPVEHAAITPPPPPPLPPPSILTPPPSSSGSESPAGMNCPVPMVVTNPIFKMPSPEDQAYTAVREKSQARKRMGKLGAYREEQSQAKQSQEEVLLRPEDVGVCCQRFGRGWCQCRSWQNQTHMYPEEERTPRCCRITS